MLAEHLPFLIPSARAKVFRMTVQIYRTSAWKIRQLSADGIFVFTNETGYLGTGTAKYIRDKADYRLDDAITAAAPLPPASATLFDVQRLPAKKLIVCNVHGDDGLVTRDTFLRAFCSGFEKAGREGCDSYIVTDPTDDWNYYTKRAEPAVGAEWVFAGIVRSRNHIGAIKILTTNDESLKAYEAELEKLRAYAPTVDEFKEPIA